MEWLILKVKTPVFEGFISPKIILMLFVICYLFILRARPRQECIGSATYRDKGSMRFVIQYKKVFAADLFHFYLVFSRLERGWLTSSSFFSRPWSCFFHLLYLILLLKSSLYFLVKQVRLSATRIFVWHHYLMKNWWVLVPTEFYRTLCVRNILLWHLCLFKTLKSFQKLLKKKVWATNFEPTEVKINELEVNWLVNQKTKNFSFSMSAHGIEKRFRSSEPELKLERDHGALWRS